MSDEQHSLEELTAQEVGDPDAEPTPLAARCMRLCKMPLNALSPGDIRLLISQEIGLEYLVPQALGLISEEILLEAELYPGDILYALLRVTDDYWSQHATERSWTEAMLREFTTKYGQIIADCKAFLKTNCGSLDSK